MHAKKQSFKVDTEYQPRREENRKLRIEDKILNISDYVDELIKNDEQREPAREKKISKDTEQAKDFCRTEQVTEEGILPKDHISNIISMRFFVRKRNSLETTEKVSTPVCGLLPF